jgi:DNA-binding CsgD family transcriptional regulator
MHITSTELTAANLHRCDALWADRREYDDRQFAQAMTAARRLLTQECAVGSIVLDDDQPRGYCITAAVAEPFADRYLRDPYPHLGKDLLLHRSAGDQRAILTRHEIGERNAGAGLQLVVLNSNVDAASPDLDSVLGVAMQSFQEIHRGYRTARIINEAFGEYAIAVLIASGCYDVRRTFGLRPGATVPSVLGTLTRDNARARHHPMLPLFVYSPPRIRFTPGEQRLLRAALLGGTDDALSARLGISLSSVKARWTRILERAGSRVPSLFDQVPRPQRANRRGTQIRHLVVRYVRANPSELTPYPTCAHRSPVHASCHQRVLTAAGGGS